MCYIIFLCEFLNILKKNKQDNCKTTLYPSKHYLQSVFFFHFFFTIFNHRQSCGSPPLNPNRPINVQTGNRAHAVLMQTQRLRIILYCAVHYNRHKIYIFGFRAFYTIVRVRDGINTFLRSPHQPYTLHPSSKGEQLNANIDHSKCYIQTTRTLISRTLNSMAVCVDYTTGGFCPMVRRAKSGWRTYISIAIHLSFRRMHISRSEWKIRVWLWLAANCGWWMGCVW